MIRGLGIVLSPSYSSHQLQLTAIKLRNSVRSSDVKKFKRNYFDLIMCKYPGGGGGGALVISGWGFAAGTLEPLTCTRASSSSAKFCYPILE